MANPNPSPETRFTVGNPGGPGRPPGSVSLRTALKAKLDQEHPQIPGKTYLDVIVENAANDACTAPMTDILKLIEAMEGKVPTVTEQVIKADRPRPHAIDDDLDDDEIEEEDAGADEGEPSPVEGVPESDASA